MSTVLAARPVTSSMAPVAERIRIRGTVQGVGFRPTVWRIAQALAVRGTVMNDVEGVLIVAIGSEAVLDSFALRIARDAPPLARVTSIERAPIALPAVIGDGFTIEASAGGAARTTVAADAATCRACVDEILDPFSRRFRYPLTNCTHCGPRLSIVEGVPYDRARTTMTGFPMCDACRVEYESPGDRRFHAEPIACHVCGPKVRLVRLDGRAFTIDAYTFLDDCDAAGTLLARGHVVAVKGLGGYQLACDATQPEAVARLRALKQRERKPFALMAANVDAVRAFCDVDDDEAAALSSAAAPIVLLRRRDTASPIAAAVAPGVDTLGFMLPSTGVHHLVLRRMKRPIVLTSANRSDEPQAITLASLKERFTIDGRCDIDYVLDHDRPITRRIDDSVTRVVDGEARVMRRARGHAPEPIAMPRGFGDVPSVLAYGSELKNTFCLLRDGEAVLSPHIGDLENAATRADYARSLRDLKSFLAFEPERSACDAHPDYVSSRHARDDAARDGTRVDEVLHHHAHIASCLVDNEWPLERGPVVGVALDGLGYGADGALWGGEFAIADYRTFDRRGTFKPVALLGGEQAMREPWRNTYAHLMAEMKWPTFAMNYEALDLYAFLNAKPRTLLDGMLDKGVNTPLASSCGRLFDAVAAAIGLCREHAAYEGQGAIEMEARVDRRTLLDEDDELAYPFAIPRLRGSNLPYVEPLAMWSALLGDLILGTPVPVIAARFHKGLANVIVKMVDRVAESHDPVHPLRHVALSGGVFQNRVLLECVTALLRARGHVVLTHRRIPCNDGGLSIGQAAVAAARSP